eukprot:CAMPEP_0201160464 /NCGR_PEP_ID=MMETSP0851-20130426/42515_1 /ASSEMBLY_ACC=CAM_ASM_000631 /TAXON_ID=183588 /ORGANISM="Pseudo-nitzschia fraudulenta, Strain WWA7" /LENGTH=186 /DNA_ID=CAMNT_0047439637 /DNA_START=62 /DNA_END=622 /DNA_ORIENTATION=+
MTTPRRVFPITDLKAQNHVSEVDESTHSTASTVSMNSIDSRDSVVDIIDDAIFCSAANDNATSEERKTKSVRFGSLEIHEHAMQLGGCGVPRNGPPTSLEWEEQSYFMIESVEEFEDARPFLHRKGSELLYPKAQRINLMLNSGHTLRAIQTSITEIDTIQKQRWSTIKKYERTVMLSKLFRLRKR